MAENSNISWTHHTFNPHRGCTKVSDGCKNCYAETLSRRNPKTLGIWGPSGTREAASEAYWNEPLKWNQAAKESGERHRVFCASLADVFEDHSTITSDDDYAVVEASRARLWPLIEATPHLDWLLLTKRPHNIASMIPARWLEKAWLPSGALGSRFPFNVWLGTSVENQKAAKGRIDHLLQVPAPVHFLSCEPLVGPVALDVPFYCCKSCGWPLGFDAEAFDPITMEPEEKAALDAFTANGCANCHATHGYWAITSWLDDIEWVIVGGESGPNARIMQAEWARSLRDQAAASYVPFHFKQWGEWRVMGSDCPLVRGAAFADRGSDSYLRVGKQDAGRVLDRRTWDMFPTPQLDLLEGATHV